MTPHNYRNGVNPCSVAFFLACLENYFVMKCSQPGDCRRAKADGGAPYGPSQPRARVRLLSRTVFVFCNAFQLFRNRFVCSVTDCRVLQCISIVP